MPITSSSTFDAVVLRCTCDLGEFSDHWVQVGTSQAAMGGDTSVIKLPSPLNPTNPEIAEVLARVKAGTATAFYYDQSADPQVFTRVEQAPQEFWQFHGRHPFWPDDGFKMLDRIATKGNLVEETSNRYFEFEGGFVPDRLTAASTMIDHSLENISVFRASANLLGFRTIIPASLEIATANLTTYADTAAFVAWLDTWRTVGDPIGANWSTQHAAFAGRRWRPPTDPDDPSRRGITLLFHSIYLTNMPGSQDVINATFFLTIESYDAGFDVNTPSTNDIAEVVNAASGSIPGAGQTIEPPFGHPQVTTRARRLESDDGTLFMAGGLALVQWEDPGFGTQRIMPLSGFGRALGFENCPARQGGGRWVPRPEERPRVDLIHFSETADNFLYFEPADRVVGFTGTDRAITIHNKSAANSLTIGIEKTLGVPQTLLVLQPGESVVVRITLELNGDSEYAIFDAPPRYLQRGASNFTIIAPAYAWATGGVNFGFRPWWPDSVSVLRRDTDEFNFGTASGHTAGDNLDDGLANSAGVVNVAHHGEIIFYEQVEIETRGSGVLSGGHSAVLIRQRGSTVNILNRFWQPQLSGVGSHRTYTTAYIDESEPGDRYLSGLIYPTSGTTIPFNQVRVNSISQVMRVIPRFVL